MPRRGRGLGATGEASKIFHFSRATRGNISARLTEDGAGSPIGAPRGP